MESSERESIKVVLRCRPFSEKESAAGHTNIAQIDKAAASVTIVDPRSNSDPPKLFTFDSVFDITSEQIEVYNKTARHIVDCVLEGYNGTVFAYGQTGTGKTFSMEGIRSIPELRGIIPNAFEQIFSYIKHAGSTTQFLVRASYLEIYNEEIRDLLNPKGKKLDIKERPDTGVYVKDLSTFVIKDVDEMDQLMSVGNKNRSVGFTEMNATSSRSHSIFSITVEAAEIGEDGEEKLRAGKLHLVDLAGSERQSKTGATGDRLKEATKINLSLSALGNVISALVDGKSSHIPYRDSKLTRLLQDSLGGNAKTLMVATISPANYNYDETLSTLRYANRAKHIKNKPKVNEDPKDAMLREFQEEIKRLKKMLESEGGDAGEIVHEVEEIEEIEEVEEIEVNDDEENIRRTSTTSPVFEANSAGGESTLHSSQKGLNISKIRSPKKDSSFSAATEVGSDVHSTLQRQPTSVGISETELQSMKDQVEKEKQAILATTGMEESERNRLLAEAESRLAELENERSARHELANKLAQLEQKLLVGGVNILDQHEQQQNMLAKQAQELEDRARMQRELQRELLDRDEMNLQIEEEFSNLQEEAVSKTRKLKKLWNMMQQQKSELKDVQEEHQREREDLLETIRELTRELKLRNLVIGGFVPVEEQTIIEDCAEYDEAAEKWRIAHIAHAGNNIRGKKSLVSGLIQGGHPTLHRDHAVNDGNDALWDPMCVFPDLFLTYDTLGLKKKDNKRTMQSYGASSANISGGSKSKNTSPSKSKKNSNANEPNGLVASDSSQSGGFLFGRAGDRSISSSNQIGNSTFENDSSARLHSEANSSIGTVIPAARGLVGKNKHYA
ncbi:hypothetical protein O5D80_007692 [Batrachochytrium dendrobatidis]|nr:hypothetical protein O5D80_007692 [Batrachochytrium dendrobatidis]